MPAIFISHSSKDPDISLRVKDWLGTLGYEQVFLDFDKEKGLGAGERWEQRLYQEILRCHAVILILTPSWISSKWCFAEFTNARAQGKIIIPLVCAPGGDTLIAPELQNLDIREWNADGLTHLEMRLRAITDDIARGFTWTPGRAPYTGLESFEAEDAPVFFGRDAETRDVIAWLDARRVQGGAPRLLVIHGASGSGKSSLLKAGVLPLLERDIKRWISLPPIRPGPSPLGSLAKVLAMAEGNPRDGARWRSLLAGPDAGDAIGEVFDGHRHGEARQAIGVLAFDQFEEVFTVAASEERRAFLALLATLCTDARDPPLLCLATARSDLIFTSFAAEPFAVPYAERLLPPMPLDRVPRLIEEPAKVGALALEPGLADCIARDMHDCRELPLLAFTLRDLYDRFARDRRLSIAEYKSLGDPAKGLDPIANAVSRRSADTMAHLCPQDDELVGLREAFVPHLVRLRPEEGVWIRHPARRADLPAVSERLVTGFIAARLLTAHLIDGEPAVEVAHEALFSAWPLLADWLEAEREFLTDLERLRAAYRIWLEAPETDKPGALLRGILLARGAVWLRDHPRRFAAGVLAPIGGFIVASQHLAASEAREQALRERRLRLMRTLAVAAVLVVAVVTSVAAFMLKRGSDALQAAVWIANSQNDLRDGRPEAAVALALQAFDKAPTADSRSAFLGALLQLSSHLAATGSLIGETGTALAWSDARTVAVTLASGKIVSIDAEGQIPRKIESTADDPRFATDEGAVGALSSASGRDLFAVLRSGGVARLDGHQAPIFVFKPAERITVEPGNGSSVGRTGAKVALASIEAGVLVLTRAADGSYSAAPLSGASGRAVDLSPDETELAFGGDDGRVTIAKLNGTGQQPAVVRIGTDQDAVTSLRWSTDGALLAAGTAGGTVSVFDPTAPEKSVRLTVGARPIVALAWSPSAHDLAFGCGEGPLCVWRFEAEDLATRRLLRLGDNRTAVRSLAWSPEGGRIVTLDIENKLRIWTLDDDRQVRSTLYAPPASELTTLAWISDMRVAAGAADGRVFGWTAPAPAWTMLDDHATGRISALAVSHAGVLAAARDDASLTIWPSAPNAVAIQHKAASGALLQLAWNADDTALTTISDGGRISSFAPRDGAETPDFCASPGTRGEAIAWNRAQKQLLVSSLDGIAAWDCTTRTRMRLLPTIGTERVSALSLAVGPEGRWLASSGGGNPFAIVYDLADASVRYYPLPTVVETAAVAFSPDGRQLAVLASGGWTTIWTIGGGKPELLVGFPAVIGTRENGEHVIAGTMAWIGNDHLAFVGLSDEIEMVSLDESSWRRRARSIDEEGPASSH